ncbi:RNA polymerase sigma factor [Spirosoma linguale]|uniref:RNA polymerase, sigma-24 subunit, ECF subfamily n=1 Tax=Spirosoma linguale (strain ATCC 33905 / DSM 74 / LMG 10896 / Claus 1) TaxID=504472 RepID=D2QLY2_SPILD|nr:RNA polymerase, sigma-24 subunit, ECF subfamily [Spirosoma linguale DSM 74]
MNTTLSDEDMIRHYLPHEPNSCFEVLYKRYEAKVYRHCLSMIKDADQAQDFTHDIFLKVFVKLNAFQERSSFSTWLYTIVSNHCLDQIRIAKRLSLSSIDDDSQLSVPDSNLAHIQEDKLQLLRVAMNSLAVKEQTLLRLKYEQGLSIDDIAKLYAITSSAVKMRLKRSREKVQLMYAKQNKL